MTNRLPDGVRVLRTRDELESVRELWEEHQRHPNVDLDFYLTLLDGHRDSMTPYVVALNEAGPNPTLLVGRVRETRIPIKVGYRTLLRPRAQVLELPYQGLLGDGSPAACQILLDTLCGALSDGDADLLRFAYLDVGSALHQTVQAKSGWLQRDRGAREQAHWVADIGDSYDDYFASFSRKLRRNIRRYSKKFVEEFGGRFEIRTYTDLEDLETVLRDTESVASTTYHRGLGVGFVANDETRRLIALAMEKGWYHSQILYIDDEPVAFGDGRRYKGTYYADTTGYRPELGNARVGLLLLVDLLKELCADAQIETLDLGLGDAEYKRSICNRQWQEARVHIFSSRIRGVSINAAMTTAAATSSLAREVLEESDLVNRVKKASRQRLAEKK